MTSDLVPGRKPGGKEDFYCAVDDCSETTRAYSMMVPECPKHGLEMKPGEKPGERS